MRLTAKEDSDKGLDLVEPGIYHAVCTWVYDLGTHYNDVYRKMYHKCLIGWELPEVRITVRTDADDPNSEQDLPRMMSKRYTLSLHEKSALRKDLETWRGRGFSADELKGFDISTLLGVNCQLQIIHNESDGKTYANIASVLPIGKGAKKYSPESGTKFFSFEDGISPPDGTPEWVYNLITESDEYQGPSGKTDDDDWYTTDDTVNEDAPF
jgi:hypothetical protein